MDKILIYNKLNWETGYKIRNLESYNGDLPINKWFRPTSEWMLFINSLLQPQNDVKLWKKYISFVSFKIVKIPQLQKVMDKILIKIACGYCAIHEKDELINVPLAIKKLIAITYLKVEIAIFKDVYYLEDTDSFFVPEPYHATPKGRNISL